jgi:hypothetical protein
MRSGEIRSRLRSGDHPRRDTHHIHLLARALAKERLHLDSRARRPGADPDLLWDGDGHSYKVVSRTTPSLEATTVFEVPSDVAGADYLLGVFLRRGTYDLIEIVRIPWTMVLWLGRAHGRRLRLTWSADGPLRGVAEWL